MDELNHRVKNMLTVVISLATQTLRRAGTLEEFSGVFLGRVHALTAAYSLLSRESWSAVQLDEIVAEELRPFMAGDRTNVVIDGSGRLIAPSRRPGAGHGHPRTGNERRQVWRAVGA